MVAPGSETTTYLPQSLYAFETASYFASANVDAFQILSCIQSAIVFFQVSKGLGKAHILTSDHDLIQVQKVSNQNSLQ